MTLFFAVLFFVAPVLAQAPALDTGIDYAKATGLVDTDIRIIIARIINVALGLLGIVALVLVIWGGYEYMTAAGDEEQIGIILSAYAITQFVISKLTDAIMGQYQQQATDVPGEPTNCVGGQCYLNQAFYAEVEPQGNLLLKNIVVMVNFKEEPNLPAPVDPSTATLENIKVVKVVSGAGTATESLAPDPYPGLLQIAPNSSGSTVEFHPSGSCAPENVDNNVCFEKNTTYKVTLSPNIKELQISGLLAKNLECSANHHTCTFYFTSGEKFDNTPPQATMVLPGNNANLPTDVKTTVSATASDDTGLQGAIFHSSKEQVPFFNLNFDPYPLSVNADQLKYENFIPQLTDKTKKETWQLSVEVKDLAGHSTKVQQDVNVLPTYCFDKVKTENTDEIGADCGPSCGACAGSGCNVNADCASGYCDLPAKICAVKTKITNVEPKDGAVGNYISIFGENFGTWKVGEGFVVFLGNTATAADDKTATIVSCLGKTSWQDDFIVAQVPDGAKSGPIKVISTDSTDVDDKAHTDSTNDDFGPVFPTDQVFVINNKVKPGICGINPQKQDAKKKVDVSGINFGAAQGTSKIKFGDVDAMIFVNQGGWTDASIAAQVPPTLPAQKLTVKTIVGGIFSNSVPFEVTPAVNGPHIDYIDPATGPKGGYVTIYGSNFGQATGEVIFYKNGATYKAEPLSIKECGNGWLDTQIVAKVPSTDALTNGNAIIKVFDNEGVVSDNSINFKIDSDKKQINLCKIEPNNGPAGQPITLYGEGFEPAGKKEGKVDFSPAGTFAIFSSWTDKIIKAMIPGNAKSGQVKVTVLGDDPPAPAAAFFPIDSNSLNFKVQNCQEEIKNKGKKEVDVCGAGQQCCSDGVCIDEKSVCVAGAGTKASVFAWSFSTGKLPVVPEVVVACDDNIIPSPTPSSLLDNKSNQVCVNAEIKVRFTSLIDSASLFGSMIVEACDDAACANPTPVPGAINYNLSDIALLNEWLDKTGDESVIGGIQDTLTFKPTVNNGLLDQNQWYRVTLTTDIKSEVLEAPLSAAKMLPAAPGTCVDPAGKKAAYCFKFKTIDSSELCKLGKAIVSPDPFIAKKFNEVYKDLYNVTAISAENKCWSINASAYDWRWNAGDAPSDDSDPSIYAKVSNDQEAAAGVLKGKPKQSLITKNKETPVVGEKVWAKTVSSNNEVEDSAVLHISPNKPKIIDWWPKCETACPNAAIGALFDMDMDAASFDKKVKLRECGNGEIFNAAKCVGGQWQMLSAETTNKNSQEFIFKFAANAFLSPGYWYEVSFNNGIKSIGGSELDESSKHPWGFKVKNDPSNCALDHVNIFPASSIVYWIGDYADYLALPFGSPDECSATGQMLVSNTYNWAWSAVDTKVAKISQDAFDPTHGLFNALASSTAVGKGDVDAATKQQKTQISTVAEGKISAPLADFILQCGFSPTDADCPLPNGGVNPNVGIGSNSCCYERPRAVKTQPMVNMNVCPNTAITVDFTQAMATSTFTSSTLGAYNIILAEDNGTSPCPEKTYQVAQEPVKGFWKKVSNWFNVLSGRPVQAQTYCAGGVKYKIAVSGTVNGSTKVSLLLEKPLAGEKTYKIIITKDVKNLYGVSVAKNQPEFSFTTKKELCKIDNVKVEPAAWLFNTIKDDLEADGVETGDKDKIFSAHAYYKTPGVDSVNQEIQSLDQYKWQYNWTSSDQSIVTINPAVGVEITTAVAVPAKNGLADIGVNAKILADQGTSNTKDKVFSATSTVQVFICENPWPSTIMDIKYGLGYVDADGNGNVVPAGQGWTNFKLMYCRDAGKPNDPTDDLPALNTPTVLTHQIGASLVADGTGIFKEFFASFAPANKNSIGLRVYSNADHLPLMEWYNKNQKLTGAPAPATVGPYKALQEGRTYYIDGVNLSGNTLYSNIYVFSFSDNPTAETLNIVNQLLSNFTFNVNVDDKEIVAKMYRDYTRLQDLKLIADELWDYYGKKGEYPKLTENPQLGTYLPAYTNSKWKSWQGVLGNLVGYTLPIDPLNGFNGCADPFDSETCWNAVNSTFVCPAGSQVYQYETIGGTEANLKADFELTQYVWNKKLVDLKPVPPCESNNCQITSGKCANNDDACLKDSDCSFGVCAATVKRCVADNKICASDNDCAISSCDLNYQISDNCNNVVEGTSNKCGDGIVGIGEVCEINAQQYLDCSIAGYPGKQSQKCEMDCSNWENIGACVPQGQCGDGVKQAVEACDDGKNNGKYGYCKTDCLGTSAEFCGDGKFTAGKEACDASYTTKWGYAGWCSLNNNVGCNQSNPCGSNGICLSSGEKYNAQKDLSCSWDCQNWDYCGDGVVNQTKKASWVAGQEVPYEQCEKSASCQVGTCSAGPQKGLYCEEDNDCWKDVFCQPTLTCLEMGKDSWGNDKCKKYKNECSNDTSLTCSTVSDCNIKCGDKKSGKKYCEVTGEKKYIKFINSAKNPYFQDATTTANVAPINELSYTDNNKSCYWENEDVDLQYFATFDVTCLPTEKPPVAPSPSSCGNGKIEAGEVCDDGKNNGVVCAPITNAPTCTYCAFGCQQVITKTKP
ncbi:MAG: hypothetical protein UU49_C0021G0022 [Candidatus Magasanikbacteria bacterium GW2011_GWC2_41_17]|uniref:IPT/TIG domain-containing protein n=1 Tax=Candidatus Magasanikbacteria bacterium GW2011_GWC2_41_17 TaxID=1619048 RepID=A0A0G0VAL4_9BACT|nr:MAG: hypothetical protein UU49_C0021G0022 [Candidatus Magasanikbacteria bacterium GW2011_GWC2_41_17]